MGTSFIAAAASARSSVTCGSIRARQWIGEWADLDPVEGGAFTLDVNAVPVRGRYLTVEPPNRVDFTWGIAGNDVLPANSTRVEVLLTAHGDDTVVELVHRDLPAVQAEPHRAGWTAFLTRLGRVSVRRQPRHDSG